MSDGSGRGGSQRTYKQKLGWDVRVMRSDYLPGDKVFSLESRSRSPSGTGPLDGMAIGVIGSNLWVSHRAKAIKCVEEQILMTSSAEKEMREMMVGLGAVDPDSRKNMEHRDNKI